MTTKDTAPGGRRTEKVGLPYDPDLFDHMVAHGVAIEASPHPPALSPFLHMKVRRQCIRQGYHKAVASVEGFRASDVSGV